MSEHFEIGMVCEGDEYPLCLDHGRITGGVHRYPFVTLHGALLWAADDAVWADGTELVRVYAVDRDARVVHQFETQAEAVAVLGADR